MKNASTIVALLSLLVSAICLFLLTGGSRAEGEVITCKQIVIKDELGNPRISIGVERQQAYIFMMDNEQNIGASLMLAAAGDSVLSMRKKDLVELQFRVGAGDRFLTVMAQSPDLKNKARLELTLDPEYELRAWLDDPSDTKRIDFKFPFESDVEWSLFDKDGKRRWTLDN